MNERRRKDYRKILSRDRVTRRFWIGNKIYWTLTERNYKWLWQFLWVTDSKDHCNYITHKAFSSLAVAWERISTADAPLALVSLTIPVLQLPVSKSNSSQRLNGGGSLTNSTTNWPPGWRPSHTDVVIFWLTALWRLYWQLALVIWPQHRPHREHRSSLLYFNCCLAGRAENTVPLLLFAGCCTVAA
jgi:hypothetical protein